MVNDTGIVGDSITSDANIHGTFVDADNDAYSKRVEIDWNSDGYVDNTLYLYGSNDFTFDGNWSLTEGNASVSFRAIKDVPDSGGYGGGGYGGGGYGGGGYGGGGYGGGGYGGGGYGGGGYGGGGYVTTVGNWQVLSFTYILPEIGSGPEINLDLHLDTNIAGDAITFDPRVDVNLIGTSSYYSYPSVEFDFDDDGQADDSMSYLNTTPTPYNPVLETYYGYSTGMNRFDFGLIEFAGRSVTTDPYYRTVYGPWVTISYQFESVLDHVSLMSTDLIATEGGIAQFQVSIPGDFDASIVGQATGESDIDEPLPAGFTYTPTRMGLDWDFWQGPAASAAGDSTLSIPMRTLEDNVDEYDDEAFQVDLELTTSELYYDYRALDRRLLTIVDNDTQPTLKLIPYQDPGDYYGNSLAPIGPSPALPDFRVAVREPDGHVYLGLDLSHPSEKDITFDIAVTDGTAIGDAYAPITCPAPPGTGSCLESDPYVPVGDFMYLVPATRLLVPVENLDYPCMDFCYPEQKFLPLEIVINNDEWFEGYEDFSVNLVAANNAILDTTNPTTAQIEIQDIEDLPVPDIVPSVILESSINAVTLANFGSNRVYPMTFEFETVSADSYDYYYGYYDYPATPIEDFDAEIIELNVAPNQFTQNIPIGIVDDTSWNWPTPAENTHPWAPHEYFHIRPTGIWFTNDTTQYNWLEAFFETQYSYSYYNQYFETVTIEDEAAFPVFDVDPTQTVNEGDTDVDVDFSRLFEMTTELNYWIDVQPVGSSYESVQVGAGTLQLNADDDLTQSLPFFFNANGLRDEPRELRIELSWADYDTRLLESQYGNFDDFYDYQRRTFIVPFGDDTDLPEFVSFVFDPASIREPEPGENYVSQTTGTITFSDAWADGHSFNLALDVASVAGEADFSSIPTTGYLNAGETQFTFTLDAIQDNLTEPSEGFTFVATSNWEGVTATLTSTGVIDNGNGGRPVVNPGQEFTIVEGANVGDIVGIVTATDPNTPLTELTGWDFVNPDGLFAIDPLTGTITVNNASLTPQTLNYGVVVSDGVNISDPEPITITVIPNDPDGNDPPLAFDQVGDFVSSGPLPLGSYLGRLPVFDPNGDELSYTLTAGSSEAISVDPKTGDLYLYDTTLLGTDATEHTVEYSATDPLGGTLAGSVIITLPPKPDFFSDAFRDSGSHREGVTFDLRPTSVSAAGETFYTTLLAPDGTPHAPGTNTTIDAYGTFHVLDNGTLFYQPNANLYQNHSSVFSATSIDGLSVLALSGFSIGLIALPSLNSPVAGAAVLAYRSAQVNLTNSQPVLITDASRSGTFETQPVFAKLDDLFIVDVSQWYVDPDGDEIVATFLSGASSTTDVRIATGDASKVVIDVVGTSGFPPTFDDASIEITIGDHLTAANETQTLEIKLLDFDSFQRFDTPIGIERISVADRDDIESNRDRSTDYELWHDRLAQWSLSNLTVGETGSSDNSMSTTFGSTRVDLTTGQATHYQSLGLASAFDDLSVPLGGLVYTADQVDHSAIAHLVIDRPIAETRDITSFEVTIEMLDHFTGGEAGNSPVIASRIEMFDTDDSTAERYELTVNILDGFDVLDSGVVRYQIHVRPVFDTSAASIAEYDITLSTSGRVAVIRETEITTADFPAFDAASYSNTLATFGNGWQLAGLPRLIFDRGDIQLPSGGSPIEIAQVQILLQMPGSDSVSVFEGGNPTVGKPYDLIPATEGEVFQPIDLRTGGPDPHEYGTLQLFGDNRFTYTDSVGTQYTFQRFNPPIVAGKSGDPTPQYRVTEILPADDSGIVISYQDDTGLQVAPSVNSVGNAFVGQLRIRDITTTRGVADPGSLTFHYATPTAKQANKIVFGDGREIELEYVAGELTKITRPAAVEHVFTYTGTADGSGTSKPLLHTITDQHIVNTTTTKTDAVLTLDYEDGIITTVTQGDAAANPIVSKLGTLAHRAVETAPGVHTAMALASPDAVFPGIFGYFDDAPSIALATSNVFVSTLAADLMAADNTGAEVPRGGTHLTRYWMDERGNPVITDSLFQPTTGIEILRGRTRAFFDALDNPVAAIDEFGVESSVVYDYTYPSGASIFGIVPFTNADPAISVVRQTPVFRMENGNWTRTILDGNATALAKSGLPTQAFDSVGRKTDFTFDDAGQFLTSVSDRLAQADQTIATTYDADNRVATTTSSVGLVTTYQYNDTAHPRRVTSTTTTVPEKDEGGILQPEQSFVVTNTYDSHGYLDTVTTKQDGVDVSIEDFHFDPLGRLIEYELLEGGSNAKQLRYNAYTYNSLGQQLTEVDGHGTFIEAVYDTASRIIEHTIAVGATTMSKTLATAVALDIQKKSTFTYYADSSLKEETLADGTVVKHYYDPAVNDPSLASLSPSLAGIRQAAMSWTVTDGVSSGNDHNALQVTHSTLDEQGRLVRSENLLTGAQSDFTYGEIWSDAPTQTRTRTNLGDPTSATPTAASWIISTAAHTIDSLPYRSQFGDNAATITQFDELNYIARTEDKTTFGTVSNLITNAAGQPSEIRETIKTPGAGITQNRLTKLFQTSDGRTSHVVDAEQRTSATIVSVVTLDIDPDGNGPAIPDIGRVLTKVETLLPGGRTTESYTDAAGQTVMFVNERGGITVNTFNVVGDLTSSHFTDPTSTTIPKYQTHATYAHDALGRVIQSISYADLTTLSPATPGNEIQSFDYFLNDQGNSLIAGLAMGLEVRQAHQNATGGITAIATDSLGKTVHTLYPEPIAPQIRQQTTQRYDFDPANATATVTVTSGGVTAGPNSATNVTTSLLNTTGQTLGVLADDLPGTPWTRITYDSHLNRASLVDPEDNTTSWTYTDQNQIASESNQLGDKRFFSYHSDGSLHRIIDRNQDLRTFIRDGLGRIETETWSGPSGNNIIQSTYSPQGWLDTATDQNASVDLDFDDAGNLTQSKVLNLNTSFETIVDSFFDPAGNRRFMSVFGNGDLVLNNDFTYDSQGRLTRIDQTGGFGHGPQTAKAATFTYDDQNRFDIITRYAGTIAILTTDHTFNDAGQLVGLSHASGSTTLNDYTWTYDEIGRIDTYASLLDGTADYDYDQQSQLTSVAYNFASTIDDFSQTYDDNGNRSSTGYVTTTDNRTTADGTYTYAFDKEGRRIKRTDAVGTYDSYTWDARGRLTSVATYDATDALLAKTGFTYDPLDRRIAKTIDIDGDGTLDEQFQYANDGLRGDRGGAGDQIAAIFDDQDRLTHTFLNGPQVDQVLAEEQFVPGTTTSKVNWLLSDNQGTPRDIARLNSAGTAAEIVNHRVFEAFGELASETDPAIDTIYGQAGREWDESTDLYFHRARYLDPATGAFISQDPIGFAAGDANLYRMVGNSPTNATDPSGLVLVAFDGTGNSPAMRDRGVRTKTNVRKFEDRYRGETIYEPGVGLSQQDHIDLNGGKLSVPQYYTTKFDEIAGGGFGAGANAKISSVIERTKLYFESHPEDRYIDVIGFSRGAAMSVQFVNDIQEFAVQNNIEIRFVGLFDTVFAMGLANNDINAGYDTQVPANVPTFHAMALNEVRDSFRLQRQNRFDENGKIIWHEPGDNSQVYRVYEEWFAGVHSNIGGGYIDNGLSDITLGWMLQMARHRGVPLDYSTDDLAPNPNGELRDSRFEFMQGLPDFLKHTAGVRRVREVLYGDTVNQSVFQSSVPNPNASLDNRQYFRSRF
ncbi:phospholipase effector Tle1 domain-containing protein [Neorhodopirellula pilleata]|uniref:phospholipase effector Tle1 domain-containing protein n=1 Tax=Neorhodopirellula pilleata TaxID=2714738 RepID=UPI0011B47B1C|nr:DUF2235 domain-containing protein [Neorhodopirellula pilleata]